MASIRQAEEQFCTSVYYLSQTTRCERLALELTTRWLMEFTSPPLPPPLPNSSTVPRPPPPPPPLPSMPVGFASVNVDAATLSTFRMPVQTPQDVWGNVVDDNFGYYADVTTVESALRTRPVSSRACVSNSTLACATGSLSAQCMNGGRRCAGDLANSRDPWVDVRFRLSPQNYLWGLRLTLPRNAQLASLIVGTKTVRVFGPRNEPLPCAGQDDEIVGVPSDLTVVVVCHPPTATDAQLHQLSTAYRARITLTGTFRQVWLAGVEPLERPLAAANVTQAAPSPPLPPPPMPTTPPSPPSTPACYVFEQGRRVADPVTVVHEPCGLTREACCVHKHERGAAAYEIDDAGCCSLVYTDISNWTTVSASVDGGVAGNHWLSESGVGW